MKDKLHRMAQLAEKYDENNAIGGHIRMRLIYYYLLCLRLSETWLTQHTRTRSAPWAK